MEHQTHVIEWIPVEERLPDDEEPKLITTKAKNGARNIQKAYCDANGWHGTGTMAKTIAWADMPEPYSDERRKEE